jgi:CheY-like chemotaxis protein
MAVVVLSAGTDSVLLTTRNEILIRLGCTVAAARNGAELVNCIFNGDFDLFVLCHSIPFTKQSKALQFLKENRPLTPVLVVLTVVTDALPTPGMIVESHPKALAEAVLQLFPHLSVPV